MGNPAIPILAVYTAVISLLLIGILRRSPRQQKRATSDPISIIVAARNAESSIGRCLEALTAQTYPRDLVEILVVDDDSTDRTLEIARRLAIETPRIRVYRNRHRFASSKKAALKTAVEQARGTYLLFTDADCTPPPTWAQGMIRSFQDDTGVVAGFAPQSVEKPSCWSRFLFTDSLASALVAAAGIGWGRGITCTGRNLGLRARALEAIGGYDALPDSVSGDDDFLLQTISRHPDWRPGYCFDHETHVFASGPAGWAPFVRQKRRHISAGLFYRPGQKLGYALFHFCNAALWFSPLLFTAALPLISKLLFDYTVLRLFVRKLNTRMTLYDFVQWEILFPLVHLVSSPALFAARIRWS